MEGVQKIIQKSLMPQQLPMKTISLFKKGIITKDLLLKVVSNFTTVG
jgi:hypothetical protein